MNYNARKRILPAAAGALAALVLGGLPAMAQDRSATDPETCRDMWRAIGLPHLTKDLADEEYVIVCHKGYVTFHNNTTKTPDWVIEHMTREQVSGDNDRPGIGFRSEPEAPADRRANDADYRNSGYARGHQAASEDFNFDVEFMKDTFFFSNAVPQVGNGFNSGVWSSLEKLVRDVAIERGEIYVITGPVYSEKKGPPPTITEEANACGQRIEFAAPVKRSICDENDNDESKACASGVAVPVGLFKIIYDPARKRVNAYVFPNEDHRPLKKSTKTNSYLKRYRVSVAVLEDYAGFDFFTALSRRKQIVIEQNCPATFLR